MSVLQDETYGQNLLAYCDMCYAVFDSEKELHYKCSSCYDYIVCSKCFPLTKVKHSPLHTFVPIIGLPNEFAWVQNNIGIRCDRCFRTDFPGRRYKCTVCTDYDVCEECFPFVNKSHELKLAPNSVKAKLNHTLLARRAVALLSNPDSPYYGHPYDVLTDLSLTKARTLVNENQNKQPLDNKLILEDLVHYPKELKLDEPNKKMTKNKQKKKNKIHDGLLQVDEESMKGTWPRGTCSRHRFLNNTCFLHPEIQQDSIKNVDLSSTTG
ncbi:unnamed protein product [Adineta steineri]|uniref:ZZ-type domain-containing protein n=1 Tax=Adineta steineri TaxID=433720 RepID=A0A814TCA2_9BILA|nr:unnamed protein product [Adineta steineri]CAF1156309.1 unnamed protein product [Adineta steineri]CAF1162314.1 unnamed protein product [Adineta steineri]CAF1179422.1 unnamed protein product [Adineta steineri]CAF1300712.1 unnamed protein product [Adineta steineri]